MNLMFNFKMSTPLNKGVLMNNTEFKKIVQESTSKYGFQYCKKIIIAI